MNEVSNSLEDWFLALVRPLSDSPPLQEQAECSCDSCLVCGAMSEHAEQSLVIQWAQLNESRYPELACLFAVPNAGRRGWQVAARMKREGLRSGVPDLCLPVARGGFNALFIEMKRLKPRQTKTKGVRLDATRITAAQQDWLERLHRFGNRVIVCYSAEDAQSAIEAYLGITGK